MTNALTKLNLKHRSAWQSMHGRACTVMAEYAWQSMHSRACMAMVEYAWKSMKYECVYKLCAVSVTLCVIHTHTASQAQMEAAGARQSVRVDGDLPEDTHTQAAQASAALIEQQALRDIFRQCGGSSWKRSGGWGSAEPVHTWYCVGCDSGGRVVRLRLPFNELRGAK
jgi:hypothetical protein